MATQTKQEFIRTFLPDTVEGINFAQIDMDISDLSLADILRNTNRSFPRNSRIRNAIKSGRHAVGILCKTELLDPLSGMLLIITGNDMEINIISRNYIVLAIQEDRICDDEAIRQVVDSITKYMIENFKGCIERFHEFYAKFIYDEDEMYDEDEGIDALYARYFS